MSVLGATLRMLVRRDSVKRVRDYYRSTTALFDAIAGRSGLMNLGLFETDDTEPADAQVALVDATVRGLEGAHWLDVGCGIGGPAIHLLERDPALRITGLNISPEQVDQAGILAEAFADRFTLKVGDADALPFPPASFDGIYSVEAAFHFRDRLQFLQQSWLQLVPGGRIGIADIVQRGGGQRLYDRAIVGVARKSLGASSLTTPEHWAALMERARFEDVQVEDVTEDVLRGFPIWADLVATRGKQTSWNNGMLRRVERSLRYLHKRGLSGPLGYVIVHGRRAPAEPQG